MALTATITLLLQTFSFFIHPAATMADAPVPISVEATSAIIIEASTGQSLLEINPDEALPPASMAKMMTEYIILDKISKGAIQWDSKVTVSEHAANIGGSGGLLAKGETYTVEDLFKAVSIYSSNDAATALAEYVAAGSVEKFAQLMNKTAKELGLSDKAYFIDPTGLDRSMLAETGYDPQSLPGETLMTARDAAKLGMHIVNDHPEALKFTSQTEAYLKPGDDRYLMPNWNWMLEGWKSYNNNFSKFAYPGLDGLKTGHTDAAGYCFTGTAQRDGMRLITVVMGTKSEPKRFLETAKLLDYGFNNFTKKTILTAKTEIPALHVLPVKKGVAKKVSLVTEKGMEFVLPKNASKDDFTIKTSSKPENEIVAPIEKGDVLGTVTLIYKTNPQIKQTVNLVAAENVEKASWWRLALRGIGNFFKDLFSGIKSLF
ncbi:MAG TPA: D-alanyl-D-alanine carboxypeptidase family protein [Bacilli bacterium]